MASNVKGRSIGILAKRGPELRCCMSISGSISEIKGVLGISSLP